MPLKSVDYSRTIIYKIVSKDLNLNFIYVGSTTDFIRRKTGHKSACYNEKNKHHNAKIYKNIRENGGWEAFEMLEIEKYECNDGNEARTRERFWMENLNANLNTLKAITTKEEYKEYHNKWHENNKEYLKDYAENYNIINKDKQANYNKEYYKKYSTELIQYQKEYANNNKERIAQYKKEYALKNADKKKAYDKERRLKKKLEKENII